MQKILNTTLKNSNVNKFLYNHLIDSFLLNKKEILFYNKLGCPKPFDVTLRDGLQSLSKEQQKTFTLEDKKEIYKIIYLMYQPKNIEIGSIVSKHILPIFSDTLELFSDIENNINDYYNIKTSINNYILIPSREKLIEVIDTPNLNNYSFITSVSDFFQKKNTKKSLNDNDVELNSMINLLENSLVTIFFIVSLSTSNSFCKELAKIISSFGKLFKYCLKLFNFFSFILYLPINLEGLPDAYSCRSTLPPSASSNCS
jgi:hypothetical protein